MFRNISIVRRYCALQCNGKKYCSQLANDEFIVERLDGSDAGIVVGSFNRPKAMNAINRNVAQQMKKLVEEMKFDKGVRAFVLKSSVPGIFCAGADLKERRQMKESDVAPFVSSLRHLSSEIENLPLPTICVLDGSALGGGLELAMCFDIIVAAQNAKLGLVETKLAIIPGAGGTQRLSRLVGRAKAKELIFTAKTIDAKEAESIRLVNHVVPQSSDGEGAYAKALEIARQIIPNGPIALRMAKQAINQGSEVDIASGLAFEQACYAQVIPTADRLEGLQAFKEKRKPFFRGE